MYTICFNQFIILILCPKYKGKNIMRKINPRSSDEDSFKYSNNCLTLL